MADELTIGKPYTGPELPCYLVRGVITVEATEEPQAMMLLRAGYEVVPKVAKKKTRKKKAPSKK